MPPEAGQGGRCRRISGAARELRSGVGDAPFGGSEAGLAGRQNRSETRCRGIGLAWGGIVSEAQRGPGVGPRVAMQSLSESLRRGGDRAENGRNTRR